MNNCKDCIITTPSPLDYAGDCGTSESGVPQSNNSGGGGSCVEIAPGRTVCPPTTNCSPFDLTQGPEDCLFEDFIEEQLNISGAPMLVHKLLGVHEQGVLQDVTGLGVAISSSQFPNNPAKNAFDKFLSEWKSLETGSAVSLKSYIGYDFGPLKLPNGRLRYALETYAMKDISSLSIMQGCDSKNRATKIRIERSSDGEKWFGVAIVSVKDCDGLITVNFKRSVPSRWWRIRPVEFNGGQNDSWIVRALQFSEYEATNIKNIQDKVLLENRERDYQEDSILIRGQYSPIDTQSFLGRYGFEQFNDTYAFDVSFRQVVARLGRPFVIGDLIILPSETQYSTNLTPVLKYLEVTDVAWSTNGYSPTWTPTIQKIVAQPAVASQETQDIMGNLSRVVDETGLMDIDDGNSEDKTYQDFSDAAQSIKSEQLKNVPVKGTDYSPATKISKELKDYAKTKPNMNVDKLDRNRTLHGIDAVPPNGLPYTEGDTFPDSPKNGDYHRLTYSSVGGSIPARLFKYSTAKRRWLFLEKDKKAEFNNVRPFIQEFIDDSKSTKTPLDKIDEKNLDS